jgi:hypothetical protein
LTQGTRLLEPSDRIVSAGSCFAANIVSYLEDAGFTYVRTEPAMNSGSERFGYGRYSAAYGNIYTARQMLQLVQRVLGRFKPAEDRWHVKGTVVDPFRPGLPYPAESDEEFDALTQSHLSRVKEAIEGADVLIETLGLTEAWVSVADGAVYPACPGTISGSFDPDRHAFKNFTVSEIVDDLKALVSALRELRPALRVILTVSPVPLVATATDGHVLPASIYSKSVLRVACEEASRTLPGVIYFPAYEIVTGPQAPDYFEPDRRNVSRAGVEAVMDVVFAFSEKPNREGRPASASHTNKVSPAEQLSRLLVETECEEMMADSALQPNKRNPLI